MSKNKYAGKGKSNHEKKNSAQASSPSPAPSTAHSSPAPQPATTDINSPTSSSKPLQPEQMSLEAYSHIQECLKDKKVAHLKKEDVTAVIQLAQHLRVFGLLSAVGYVRHARDGKIRERIRPMWTPLLWRLICGSEQRPKDDQETRQALMNKTYILSTQNQKGYMVKWRQALQLSNHWNFWARAYQEEEANEQSPEDSNPAS